MDISTKKALYEHAPDGFRLGPHTFAMMITGSVAYGTETPDSDLDYFGVVVPPMERTLGPREWTHWEGEIRPGLDTKFMDLRKFVRLAVAGNPNVVELLFLPPECVVRLSPVVEGLWEARNAFLSVHVYRRFIGYARGQFDKMTAGAVQGYMGHKRKEIVQAMGYDTKDASHLARLLFKARELAVLGTLTPRLLGLERTVVREIKQGQWSLEQVKSWATEYDAETEALMAGSDMLPAEPDLPCIEAQLVRAFRMAWEIR